MTFYTLATLDALARKIDKRADLILKQFANDLGLRASRTAEGVTRGGSVKAGYVPRDKGFLAASFVSGLNGSTMLSGDSGIGVLVSGMKAGDSFQMGWTAVYARKVHYDGWLFRDEAVADAQNILDDVVKRAKAMTK
jgi:hypothetical protein